MSQTIKPARMKIGNLIDRVDMENAHASIPNLSPCDPVDRAPVSSSEHRDLPGCGSPLPSSSPDAQQPGRAGACVPSLQYRQAAAQSPRQSSQALAAAPHAPPDSDQAPPLPPPATRPARAAQP